MVLKGKRVKLSFEGEIGCRRSQLGLKGEPIKLDGKSEKAKQSTTCSSKTVDMKKTEQLEEDLLKQECGEITGAVSIDMDDSGNKDVMRDDHPRKGKSRLQRGRVIRKQKVYAKRYDLQADFKRPLSKSRSEVVHKEVVQTGKKKTNLSMGRQKHYHDRKPKWKTFDHDEEMHVSFPRKHGTSPKLKSLWQGPYLVVKTLSRLTYLVKWDRKGPRGSNQIIPVDLMGKEYNCLQCF
jgi:hypothetical protein